jgi:hypothetical protein
MPRLCNYSLLSNWIYKGKKRKVQTPTLAFLINLPDNNNNNNETGQKFTIKQYTCKITNPVYMQTKIREPVSKTTNNRSQVPVDRPRF